MCQGEMEASSLKCMLTTGTVWRTSNNNSSTMLISIFRIFRTSGFHFKTWDISLHSVNWKQMCCSKGSANTGQGPKTLIAYDSLRLLAAEHGEFSEQIPPEDEWLQKLTTAWTVLQGFWVPCFDLPRNTLEPMGQGDYPQPIGLLVIPYSITQGKRGFSQVRGY